MLCQPLDAYSGHSFNNLDSSKVSNWIEEGSTLSGYRFNSKSKPMPMSKLISANLSKKKLASSTTGTAYRSIMAPPMSANTTGGQGRIDFFNQGK